MHRHNAYVHVCAWVCSICTVGVRACVRPSVRACVRTCVRACVSTRLRILAPKAGFTLRTPYVGPTQPKCANESTHITRVGAFTLHA